VRHSSTFSRRNAARGPPQPGRLRLFADGTPNPLTNIAPRLAHRRSPTIPGRENVRWVSLDMSDSNRGFARSLFPRAQLVADKFHVLRLLTPTIHRALHALKLPREALPMYRVLRKNPSKLMPAWRWKLRCWLADKPARRELCAAREAIFRLYQVRGHSRASKALTGLTDAMAYSSQPEVQTFRTTLPFARTHHQVRRAEESQESRAPPRQAFR
jgi:transposase